LIGHLYPYIFNNPRLKHTLQSFFSKGLDRVDDPLFSHMIRWENTSKVKTFFSSDLSHAIGSYSGYEQVRESLPKAYERADFLSRAQYLETAIFLGGYLLSSQGDRMAMAHSVEIRLPFLDPSVMDFMGRVPAKWKILGLNEKHILKKTFEGILPEAILRRPKNPYRAPIRQSLLNRKMLDCTQEILSETSLKKANLFDTGKVSKLLRKMQASGSASEIDDMALMGILSSQLIYQQFVEDFPLNPACEVCPDLIVDYRSEALKPVQ
jgi:asparagine synthase (glutamine-hydrolysing)